MFEDETQEDWKILDTTLGDSIYSNLQVVQILLWISQLSETETEKYSSIYIDDLEKGKTVERNIGTNISDQGDEVIKDKGLNYQDKLRYQLSKRNIIQENFPQLYQKNLL